MPPDPVADTLRSTFGFADFRPGQEDAVRKLVAGKSVLTVFPTGAGKSLCYQLPALLLDGLTLVISPLIALMKDQLDALAAWNVPAARLDSTLTWDESRKVFDDLTHKRLKLLYVAPERLASERFLQTLKRLSISMLAIDEAHCISEWGHNFRPDYLKLAQLARDLKVGRVLALTATATPAVAGDIARAFGIADDDIVQTGFYRPNLELHVTPCPPDRRVEWLRDRLVARAPGSTIVYVTLQRTAEQVAERLASQGLPAKAYHAGLEGEHRAAVQDWFMAKPDAIVVATIAFGMGIDKADIRYVYHFNVPKSLENYAQEIGRAGRDGKHSLCEMLACADDRIVLENFTYGDTPTAEAVRDMLDEVARAGDVFDVSVYDLSQRHDIRPLVVETLLTYLELVGLIVSTGPFYAEYQFQPNKSSAEILARFDAERARFLRRVLSHARKAKTWFHLDVHKTAEAINEPRNRIVTALNYLEEQGDLVLKVAGVRAGYRRTAKAWDGKKLAEKLVARFQDRERRDVERLHKVLAFAQQPGCWTRELMEYFGDPAEKDCGHCGRCKGVKPAPLPGSAPAQPGERDRKVIRDVMAGRHAALASPRQMTRYLCGLTSPQSSRAKLTKEKTFGTLGALPFQAVLEAVEAEMGG